MKHRELLWGLVFVIFFAAVHGASAYDYRDKHGYRHWNHYHGRHHKARHRGHVRPRVKIVYRTRIVYRKPPKAHVEAPVAVTDPTPVAPEPRARLLPPVAVQPVAKPVVEPELEQGALRRSALKPFGNLTPTHDFPE